MQNDKKSISVDKNNVVSTGSWESDTKKEVTKENFYSLEIPNDYNIENRDLILLKKMLDNDHEFFKSENSDLDFFNISRDYLFWDNYSEWKLDNLIACIWSGVSNSDTLSWDYKSICEWKNVYIKESDTNFFHIKDKLNKYKDIVDWKDVSCEYFLSDIYDYPSDQINYVRKTDYISCKKLKNIKGYSIKEELFYYTRALEIGKCEFLNDKNLIKLCNEELERNSAQTEK